MNSPRPTVAAGGDAAAFAPPSQLTATPTNGGVLLHWRNNAGADGGHWVEFATPGSEYTKLNVAFAGTPATSFFHRRVAPQSIFLYRIEPYFGSASRPVEITTGTAAPNAPALEEGPLASGEDSPAGGNRTGYSLRNRRTMAKAVPVDLTAALSSPTSVDFYWKDCASDEDGYLLEVGLSPRGDFQICALLPPNTTSFRKTQLPAAARFYFRVRAYVNGKPSAVISVRTSAP